MWLIYAGGILTGLMAVVVVLAVQAARLTPDPEQLLPVQLIWPGRDLDVVHCEVSMTRQNLREMLGLYPTTNTPEEMP